MSTLTQERPRPRTSSSSRPSTARSGSITPRDRPRSPVPPSNVAASAAQALKKFVDDMGDSSGGEEATSLTTRPAIEPIDQPDREFEEKIQAFFDFEKQLEGYYWHCSELRTSLGDMLHGAKTLVEKTRLLSKPTDTGVNRIIAYSLKLEDTLQLFQREFIRTYDAQCLLPVGRTKSGFGEIKVLIQERDQVRLEVHHYQKKVATLGGTQQNKKTLRNYDKMRASFGNLENATAKVAAKLAEVDEFRKRIIRQQVCDLFKIIQDILHEIAADISTATKTEPSTGEKGCWYDRDIPDYPSAAQTDQDDIRSVAAGTLLATNQTSNGTSNVVFPKNFVLRHFMKHKEVPDINQLLVAEKPFLQAARIYEECDGGFPNYREALFKVREATINFFQGAMAIVDDVQAMVLVSELGEIAHVTNYQQVFFNVLNKLNNDIGPMYDQRFLHPIEMEISAFPDTRVRIQQRLEDAVEHHHYKAKLEEMAKNIHRNAEDKTMRNQHKFAQLTESLRIETRALITRFEELDALRHTIVMFHLSEFMDIETTVLEDAVLEMRKVRDQWRRKRILSAHGVRPKSGDIEVQPSKRGSDESTRSAAFSPIVANSGDQPMETIARGRSKSPVPRQGGRSQSPGRPPTASSRAARSRSPSPAGPRYDPSRDANKYSSRQQRSRSPSPAGPRYDPSRDANKYSSRQGRSRSPSPAGRSVQQPVATRGRSPPPNGRQQANTNTAKPSSAGGKAARLSPHNSVVHTNGLPSQAVNGSAVPRPFEPIIGGAATTLSLTELFEEYDATIYETGPLGMRMVKIREVSSVTGASIEWGQIQMVGPDSLAQKAGIETGSILTELNGQPTVGIPQSDVMELIKSSPRPLRMKFVLKKVFDIANVPPAADLYDGADLPSTNQVPFQQYQQPSPATSSSVIGGEVVDDGRIAIAFSPPPEPPPMSPEPPATSRSTSAQRSLRRRMAAKHEQDHNYDSIDDKGPAKMAAMQPNYSSSSAGSMPVGSPRRPTRPTRR